MRALLVDHCIGWKKLSKCGDRNVNIIDECLKDWEAIQKPKNWGAATIHELGNPDIFAIKTGNVFPTTMRKKSVGCGISKFVCLLRGTSLIEIPSNPYSWWNSMYIPILSPFIHYIGTDSPSRLFACLLRTGSPLGDRKRVSSKQCPKAIGKEKYPLVNIQKAMERSTIFNGKIHYKWSFSIANC